jgi:hypothetical protein
VVGAVAPAPGTSGKGSQIATRVVEVASKPLGELVNGDLPLRVDTNRPELTGEQDLRHFREWQRAGTLPGHVNVTGGGVVAGADLFHRRHGSPAHHLAGPERAKLPEHAPDVVHDFPWNAGSGRGDGKPSSGSCPEDARHAMGPVNSGTSWPVRRTREKCGPTSRGTGASTRARPSWQRWALRSGPVAGDQAEAGH